MSEYMNFLSREVKVSFLCKNIVIHFCSQHKIKAEAINSISHVFAGKARMVDVMTSNQWRKVIGVVLLAFFRTLKHQGNIFWVV